MVTERVGESTVLTSSEGRSVGRRWEWGSSERFYTWVWSVRSVARAVVEGEVSLSLLFQEGYRFSGMDRGVRETGERRW